MGRWFFRLSVKILAILRLKVNIIPMLSPEKFLYGKFFLRITVKICKFLRLTVKFLAVLQLSVNPNKTFQKKRSSRTGLNITGS